MKKIIVSTLLLMFAQNALAQDLPPNPEPGKCYVRCKTPEVWKDESVNVEISPAYKKIVTHPAEYKKVSETVLVKEAGQRLEVIPAVWGTEEVEYTAKEDANALTVTPASFSKDTETVETKVASAKWEMSDKAASCMSNDPNDCRYWCYKKTPAEFKTVSLTKLDSDAYVSSTPVPGFTRTYTKNVMLTPPTTRVVDIPAEYEEITKVVLVKDAWKEEIEVPAEYKTVNKRVIVSKGGLTTWKEVECELTNNNLLPINWNLGSADLTRSAKEIINIKLLPILQDGMSVVIESHTDSRGSASSNKTLSERRAKAVADYLAYKGISPSQVRSYGYGEERLANRCADGVSCSESKHRENRRTVFRVINE